MHVIGLIHSNNIIRGRDGFGLDEAILPALTQQAIIVMPTTCTKVLKYIVTLSLIMSFASRFRVASGWSTTVCQRRRILVPATPSRTLSAITRFTKKHVEAIMEGLPKVGRSSHDLANHFLKKEDLFNMKTSELKMELSFRGLKTTGDRVLLTHRLARVLDEDSNAKTRKPTRPPTIDPQHLYVLHTKGHTTQNSGGLGSG